MKTYNIKPEFLSAWGSETTEDTVVTEAEILRLANEWGVSADELMEQVVFCGDVRFEIWTDRFEFRFGTARRSLPEAMTSSEIFEAYMEESCREPQTEASFDTLEEAKAEFSSHYADAGRTWAEKGSNFWLLCGEVAWIEETTYDADGEFDQGGCTYIFSAEGFQRDEDEEEE